MVQPIRKQKHVIIHIQQAGPHTFHHDDVVSDNNKDIRMIPIHGALVQRFTSRFKRISKEQRN